ncbi:thiamine/molybdopterin biosynthesis ThiF/MoeB-like protein [Azoarcus sp. Aa7]|nr:thiamine/molybdopterin biosynthesis ThiF/MoeB-like protein [Azoarcus sp. Aa7]
MLGERMARVHGEEARAQFLAFLNYLELKGIIIEPDWLARTGLDEDTLALQQRQLAFLLDVLGSPERAAEIQRKISQARLVCFGVGAVGSWLLRQLLGLGFRRFVLVDHDRVEAADVSRHAFFNAADATTGAYKATAVAERMRAQFEAMEVTAKTEPLTTESVLETLIEPDTDFVINAADEPYIGYTSVLLSRFCVPRRLPLLVVGGFNAHLGSLSELVIPGVTPCADCYADYFRNALKDWTPVEHPVLDRRDAAGGLCSLAVFAAGTAAMKVFRYFMGEGDSEGGRGELLFDNYRLDAFKVERQPNCPICSSL